MTNKSPLLPFGASTFSQAGEDGILAEILRRLDRAVSPSYVDIGAHNGVYLSNVEMLRVAGWPGLSVESDAGRFMKLLKHCEQYAGSEVLCAEVHADTVNALRPKGHVATVLDLRGQGLPVWRALNDWTATVVIAGVLARTPLGVRHEHGPASFSSMVDLADAKGYALAAYTGLNCIFIHRDQAYDVLDAMALLHPERLYMNVTECKAYRSGLAEPQGEA
ncbi:MAG: hypothetical protein GY851_35640 [bacterium]|nr:hypothetical protein [bacterium]